MGAGTSSAARDGAGGPVRPSRLAGLRATGRYFELPATGGGVVRVLGVCPSSTRCEEEAFDLVASTQPSHVYIDLPREWTDALLADVRAQRVGDWKIPDTTPPFRLVPGAGVLGSVLVRNALADNEMLGLMGGEAYGPYKAALAAGEALRRGDGSADGDGGGGGSEGSASTASAAAAAAGGGAGAQPAYVSYPFPMAYNGGAMLDRPSHVATFLLGDNSFGSTTVFAMIGNSVAIMAGEPGLAEFAAALPPDAGYFTRDGVTKLRRDFRAAVNAAVARVTADTADLEADLTRREEAARAAGDAAGAAAFEASVVKSQVQAQATAYALREAAAEAGPDSSVVAIVNLGTLASLRRNWEEARPPAELVPPFKWYEEGLQYVLPTVLFGSTGYLWFRGFRRFPKTFAGLGAAVVVAGAGFANSLVYADRVRYGTGVRAALARPRVVSAVARLDRPAPKR